MNIKSLRALIRLSIKQKILAENRKNRNPLETFSDFKRVIQESLFREGLDDINNVELEDFIFERLYSAWVNINTEMKFISSSEKIRVWNDSVSFHLPLVIENIVRTISHNSDADKVTKIVVSNLLK